MNVSKSFSSTCPTGLLGYMSPLKQSKLSERLIFVFFILKAPRISQKNGCFEHVPNLICCQKMCPKYESSDNTIMDCVQCEKREHVFWGTDFVGILSTSVY